MKTAVVTEHILFFVLLLVVVGCEGPQVGVKRIETQGKSGNDCNEVFVYSLFVPTKIDIIPLTEYTGIGSATGEPGIKVYLNLLDSFGYQLKSPGVFRFELYNRVPRSAEPKGKRIKKWPDIDLTDVVENNNYWRDFLRAYEFSLPIELETRQNRILQATFLCPNGKRLSAEFMLIHRE